MKTIIWFLYSQTEISLFVAEGFNNNMLSSVIVCWSTIIYIPAQPAAEFILFFLCWPFHFIWLSSSDNCCKWINHVTRLKTREHIRSFEQKCVLLDNEHYQLEIILQQITLFQLIAVPKKLWHSVILLLSCYRNFALRCIYKLEFIFLLLWNLFSKKELENTLTKSKKTQV